MIFDLVLGLVTLGLGVSMVAGRHRIVANHKRRLGRAEVPALWIVLGGLLTLVGVLALINAFK